MFTPPIGSLLDMDLSTVALSSDVPPKNSRGQPVQNSDGLVSFCTHSRGQPLRESDEAVRHRTRADQPKVIFNSKASKVMALESASTSLNMAEAVKSLEEDFHAASSKASRSSRLNTWLHFHAAWFKHVEPWPLTKDKIIVVGAMFKKGKYRSFKGYLSRAKEEHVKQGHEWSPMLERLSRDVSRSVGRGLAPKKRSGALDFEKAMNKCMKVGININKLRAPFAPYALICLGTFFLCREIELAGALAVELSVNLTDAKVTFTLPVSKTDINCRGVERTLGCLCEVSNFCPFHLAKRYLKELRQHFVVTRGLQGKTLPLFPRADGTALTKDEVVVTLKNLVRAYGGRLVDEVGRDAISGHAFRITGARLLSSWGIDPITIGLHGRWSSSAIMSYIADSPLSTITDRLRSNLALKELQQNTHRIEEGVAESSDEEELECQKQSGSTSETD